MAPAGGIMAPITMRILRHGLTTTLSLIKARIAGLSRPLNNELQPILARTPSKQAIHRVALLRQSKGRWYTTHSTINAVVRRFMSGGSAIKHNRAAFPKSATATVVARLTTRAPFASTLRPNLTGGAIPRTSGGYSLGGGRINGARYFSHTPAAPAQVFQNASIAARTFWLSGQKAHFNGMTPGGEKRFRRVSSLQDETSRKMTALPRDTPGSYIEFRLTPIITCVSPLGAGFPFCDSVQQVTPTLNTPGFMDVLAMDFARAVKDIAITMNDIKSLSVLGDLTAVQGPNGALRIRFPGCDADTVERLCDEVGVKRGTVHQDPEFDDSVGNQMALAFPFAPTAEQSAVSTYGSLRSAAKSEFPDFEWYTSGSVGMESYGSIEDDYEAESLYYAGANERPTSSDYEGVEGIHRFIEQCDLARRAW